MVTTFFFNGAPHKLDLSPAMLTGRYEDCYYTVMIDNYYYGRIFKNGGLWFPLDSQRFDGHCLFRFEGSDYQVMGEIIEAAIINH